MKAKLKRIYSPDVDFDSFWPEDTENFGFLLQAMIGPEGEDGEESFGIQVCTPEWLKSRYSENDVLFGRHMMIVFDYDIDRIKSHIVKYCDRCVGDNWSDIASKLSRIGLWEFEDYSPA
ncbi:immunity 8 family protein [Vibrio sp. J1-1]|uniref:immunity 8 family protein n=1 Tax=Vibrio sp. J1-1 TaxID=2912251 RepID=UPI001F3EE085|nr:immunity 8 family protein [Vibrio sp. J1-1]MCF7484267.1 immunity 8 family protein [Vibrio sp. J1-1]